MVYRLVNGGVQRSSLMVFNALGSPAMHVYIQYISSYGHVWRGNAGHLDRTGIVFHWMGTTVRHIWYRLML